MARRPVRAAIGARRVEPAPAGTRPRQDHVAEHALAPHPRGGHDRGDRELASQPHLVRLEARPANAEGIGAASVVSSRAALRMRPDRLVVEVRSVRR
jgi:hypothetical protein